MSMVGEYVGIRVVAGSVGFGVTSGVDWTVGELVTITSSTVGDSVGKSVDTVGKSVGEIVGKSVTDAVGISVLIVGKSVGDTVGKSVGGSVLIVGAAVVGLVVGWGSEMRGEHII